VKVPAPNRGLPGSEDFALSAPLALVGRDVQRYLANEVVEARPPSAVYQLKKYTRRQKLLGLLPCGQGDPFTPWPR
jgi:hypothetical protein